MDCFAFPFGQARRMSTLTLLASALFFVCAVATPSVARATPPAAKSVSTGPIVKMVTTKGPILIKLFPKDAPISCANFLSLVKSGFYNGLMFHRVTDLGDPTDPEHIVQGGDPNSRNAQPGDPSLGQGGSAKTIKGEFPNNGVSNPLTHNAGAVAMARSSENDSASSQFYICTSPCHHLDGNYAVFGMVIKGLDNAAKIQVGDRITKATILRAK